LVKTIEISSFKPGDIIQNRYYIKKQILACKSTGWDETYLAIDRDSPDLQLVVIKYLKLNISGRGRLMTAGILFDREIDKLANLSSQIDFIPRFHDRFQDGDEFYLVQEYMGRSMAEVLANIRLSESEVFSLIKTILNRLQTIHSHGVIYNCLTLDSVVLRDRDGKLGFLYCGDISNVIEIKTSQLIDRHITFTCYVDRYKAPEVLAKRAEFSSDIYAVGAIAIQ
jgi:eukaryotic-like serine/threonine-protein kinase